MFRTSLCHCHFPSRSVRIVLAAFPAAHGLCQTTRCPSSLGAWQRTSLAARTPLQEPRRFYREILKNTLSDTPSGYLQDPRAAPTQMVTYTRLSEAGEAALEALQREEDLSSREELAYPGYTSVRADQAKERLLTQTISPEDLAEVARVLEEELEAVLPLVGQTIVKPLTENQRQLARWRRERARLEAIERDAFVAEFNGGRAAAVEESTLVEVVVDPVDGTERVVRRTPHASQAPASRGRFVARDSQGRPIRPEDLEDETKPIALEDVHVRPALDAHDSETDGTLRPDDEEEETFLAAAAGDIRGPVEVEVTAADAQHLRYLLGLAHQRLGHFEQMEVQMYAILAENPYSTDAIQSLLDVYTGLETTHKIGDLIDFVSRVEADMAPVDVTNEANAHTEHAEISEMAGDSTAGRAASSPPSASTLSSVELVSSSEPSAKTSQLTPPEIVIALLAELLTETAALFCRDHGEGATSRFFLQALGPLARRLGPEHTATLLEALFQSFDAQHFVARAEADDPALAASRELIYAVVIAFLKTLVSRDMAELVRDPVRFQFFTLTKLHAALRSASGGSRRQESYRVCERMLKLYRANSSVYTARIAATAKATAPAAAAAAREDGPASASSAPVPVQPDDASLTSPTAGALDDQDENYRIAYMQYVRDRAKDASAPVGRALCLAAMEEFPAAAEPWEVLALLLHRADPKKNLPDAILAAQRARELDPFDLGAILTLANFYKADNRTVLYERMLERFRLLSFMMESGATREDMASTLQEIADMETTVPREDEPDLVEETSRPMKEFYERYDMHTTYSMPINKEVRQFGTQPLIQPAQMAGLPHEVLHGEPNPPSSKGSTV